MKLKTPILILALASVVTAGYAQSNPFDSVTAGDSTVKQPWDNFKLPRTKVKLDFHNANVDLVLGLFQSTSHITIVKDPTLTGGITITSAGQVSIGQAFTILSTVLRLRGFDLNYQSGSPGILVINARAAQTRGGGGTFSGTTSPFPTDSGNSNESELRVYTIEYADAQDVARVINEVFTPQTTNNSANPFAGFGGGGFGGGGFGGAGGGGAAAQLNNFRRGFGAQTPPAVHASYEEFSNTVVVNAPATQQLDVAQIIKKIDVQSVKPLKTQTFSLKYASASDLATTIQNVLTSQAPQGRGATSRGNTGGGGGPGAFFSFVSSQRTQNSQVSPDVRSNTLTVTTTDDNMQIVGQVIAKLDQPTESLDATTIVPLMNARADTIASELLAAFGSLSGTTPSNTNQFTRTVPTNQATTTTGGTSGGGSASRPTTLGQALDPNQVFADSSEDGPPDTLQLALQDPTATQGPLLTSVAVQGGFGGLFGGGGGQNSQTSQNLTPVPVRDYEGQVANLHNPVGKVTIIPDTNTNSLIVVGAPDVTETVKKVIEQLDSLPEQVVIETYVVEATLDNTDNLGVEWKLLQNSGDLAATAASSFGLAGQVTNNNSTNTPTGFSYTMAYKNLTAFLNAISTNQKFTVLSRPTIFTANDTQSTIDITQSVPYISNSTVSTAGQLINTTSFLNVGIILTIVPRITANGFVNMDINQTDSDLQGYTSFNAPITNNRQASTTVAVKDGETVVLGGIISNQVSTTTNKIPLLGDIPFFGNLFKSTTSTKQKTELLVFLVPHVIRNSDDARAYKDSIIKQLSPQSASMVKQEMPETPSMTPKPTPAPENEPKGATQ